MPIPPIESITATPPPLHNLQVVHVILPPCLPGPSHSVNSSVGTPNLKPCWGRPGSVRRARLQTSTGPASALSITCTARTTWLATVQDETRQYSKLQHSTIPWSTVQGGGGSLFSALLVSVHQHSPSLASFRHSQCITGQHGTVQCSANGLCSIEQHRVWGPVSHCQHCPAHYCLVWPYHGSHPSPWSWLHRSNRLTGQHAHSLGVAGLVC